MNNAANSSDVNPSTLVRNIFYSNYIGPWNPKDRDGNWLYKPAAKGMIDLFARKHDQEDDVSGGKMVIKLLNRTTMISKVFKSCLLLFPVLFFLLSSCGTLGSIGPDIYFQTSKEKLEIGIDSFFLNYPNYKMPQEWSKYNDWSRRGYDFLESRIFYFKYPPEEMYFVSLINDSSSGNAKIGLGIRAVNRGSGKWLLDADLNKIEKERIYSRFRNEIVSKIEEISGLKSY